MIVDFPPAVLIVEALVQLTVGEDFPGDEGLKMESTESLAKDWILAMVGPPQAREKPAVAWFGGSGHLSPPSERPAETHHGLNRARRQGSLPVVDRPASVS